MRLERRSAAVPTRLLLLVAITVDATACVMRQAPRASTGAPADIAQLWNEPRDLEKRDLFHGAGGAALAPNPSTPYHLVAIDNSGYSPGYDVRDERGAEWSVKLGIEAQPEVVASRVLWAIGYHQPPTYLLKDWKLTGKQVETPGVARFRLESGGYKVTDDNLRFGGCHWLKSTSRISERRGPTPRRDCSSRAPRTVRKIRVNLVACPSID